MNDPRAAPPDCGPWLLYRIDDNGNEVPMRYFAERAEAEAAMRDFERRGHKQAYLVRAAAPPFRA